MKQNRIPDPPPITDGMTQFSHGAGAHDLLGTVVCVYDIPDSDRDESLLRFDDGRVICVSCDPVTHDDESNRLPVEKWGERWEVVLYDATDTEAGKAMQGLEPGHWL